MTTKTWNASEAVRLALKHTIVGDQSSLPELITRAQKFYAGSVTSKTYEQWYGIAHSVRRKWRKTNNIQRDARTHRDVPDRNMLAPNKMEPANYQRAVALVSKIGQETFTELRELFHSTNQMQQFDTSLKTYCEVVELS